MSLNADLETVISNIELPPSKVALISDRYAALSSQLKSQLPHASISQIGSFQRKTKINPAPPENFLDLDIACSFTDVDEWTVSKLKPRELMVDVIKALHVNKTYKSMRPKGDLPIVVVEYADNLSVEIVPCLRAISKDSSRPPHYYIASDQTNWKVADYDYDAQYISQLNQNQCNQRLIPCIKLIKAMLRPLKKLGLSSFQVEVLAAKILPQIFEEMAVRWDGWGLQDVLASYLCYVPRFISLPIILPGSKSSPLQLQYPSEIGNKFMALGTKAREINSKGDQVARMFWKKRFGALLPG